MKINQLSIILFFTVFSLSAQEFKLGKVSVAELQEKAHPNDTSATAAVLYKKGLVRLEYNENDGLF